MTPVCSVCRKNKADGMQGNGALDTVQLLILSVDLFAAAE